VAIKPEDFLNLAHSLSTAEVPNCSKEAIYRSVISRAYYGAFLSAQHYSKIKNSSGSVHGDVIKHFNSKDSSICNRLASMKKLRTEADYYPNKTLTAQDANTCCRQARQVINKLIQLTNKS
jgi:uncharacterized protein (UPF0332 family)